MYLVAILATAAILADCQTAVVSKEMLLVMDNSIERLSSKAVEKQFLNLPQKPEPLYELKRGDTLDLVCDAVGSPAPSVRWFKNDAPVYEYDIESNEVIDSTPSSVARLTSTLLVSRVESRDQYTCLATAGDKTVRATTTVYGKDGDTDFSERTKLYPLIPKVVVWYKVYVNTIGSDAVLPCKAKGHPRPRVTWKDNRGKLIKNDARFKVLRSGELVISALRWSDMGQFSCQAINVFGSVNATTFLYPAKAD